MRSQTLWTLPAFVLVLGASAYSAEQDQEPQAAGAAMPVGRWSVAFANGVTEICEIAEDGSASVVEPRRASGGRAAASNGAFVITSEDDRVERWTPVGQRMVVEHWYPAAQFPCGTPVLGIAERVQNAVVEVSLEGPNVNDASLVHLKELINLELLILKRTNVTDAGAAKLQEALPNCLISHSPRN